MGSSPSFLRVSDHALVDQLDALGVIAVGGLHLQRALEIVQDGQDLAHHVHGGELQVFRALAFGAAARVLELGAGAQQAVLQLGLFGGKLIAFGGQGRELAFQNRVERAVLGQYFGRFS